MSLKHSVRRLNQSTQVEQTNSVFYYSRNEGRLTSYTKHGSLMFERYYSWDHAVIYFTDVLFNDAVGS